MDIFYCSLKLKDVSHCPIVKPSFKMQYFYFYNIIGIKRYLYVSTLRRYPLCQGKEEALARQ